MIIRELLHSNDPSRPVKLLLRANKGSTCSGGHNPPQQVGVEDCPLQVAATYPEVLPYPAPQKQRT